jgi:hypothetical protein
MAPFLLVSAILLAIVSVLFYVAGDSAGHGAIWATQLCSVGSLMCDAPYVASVLAGGLGAFWVVVKLVS